MVRMTEARLSVGAQWSGGFITGPIVSLLPPRRKLAISTRSFTVRVLQERRRSMHSNKE